MSLDADIHQRIEKGYVANGMLEKQVYVNGHITHKTKMNVYSLGVVSVLFY